MRRRGGGGERKRKNRRKKRQEGTCQVAVHLPSLGKFGLKLRREWMGC
jgi:hypothetical protein